MSLPVDYVAFTTAFATSVLAQYLVSDFLQGFSQHTELWIGVFFSISIYLIIILLARQYLYSEKDKKSLYWKSRQDFLQFLYSIVLFTLMQFFFQVTVWQLQTTNMCFNDYMNFANFGIFFIFVFVRRLQSVLTPGAAESAEKGADRQETLIEKKEQD